MVCDIAADTEKHYIRVLLDNLTDPRLSEAYQSSDGLCLPHFRQALRATSNSSTLDQLIGIQQAIWSRLHSDLQGFVDKSDYQHSHEIAEEEGKSWRWATRIAGERGVFGPDR